MLRSMRALARVRLNNLWLAAAWRYQHQAARKEISAAARIVMSIEKLMA